MILILEKKYKINIIINFDFGLRKITDFKIRKMTKY